MNLVKYDNKCIRLEDKFGNIYEGICTYNNKEYNYHEYNKSEESLVMSYTMFYKSLIKKVKCINEFTSSYGKLEEELLEDGMILIEEVLDSEEDISIIRMLLCLKDNIDSIKKEEISDLKKSLEILIKYNKNKDILKEANELLDIIKKE